MGIQCPPATHNYHPHGKLLFCTQCGDVQPLLLDIPEPASHVEKEVVEPQVISADDSVAEAEAYLTRLRRAAGLPTKEPGGLDGEVDDLVARRGVYAEDFEPDRRRIPVPEGFEGHPQDDSLPGAGL